MTEEIKKKLDELYIETGKNLMDVLMTVKEGEKLALALYIAKVVVRNDRNRVIELMLEEIRGEILNTAWSYSQPEKEVIQAREREATRDKIVDLLKTFVLKL